MTLRVVRTAATILVVLLASWPVHAQDRRPSPSSPQASGSSDLRSLQNDFRRLVEANQLTEALPVARRIVEISEGLSVAQRIGAHFDLASLMRELDDLDGAILEYTLVIGLAQQTTDLGPYLGMVYDNIAMIRRAQEQWDAAETASDRAIEIFAKTLGEHDTHYGAALNNRAIILSDQGKMVLALDYSERAIAVLRESFAGQPKALEPFLEDNRRIRAQMPR
jgi:tetratricopeptide (TPR) repeat protein